MIYNNKVTASTPLLHDIVPFREKIGFGWFLKGMWLREKKKKSLFLCSCALTLFSSWNLSMLIPQFSCCFPSSSSCFFASVPQQEDGSSGRQASMVPLVIPVSVPVHRIQTDPQGGWTQGRLGVGERPAGQSDRKPSVIVARRRSLRNSMTDSYGQVSVVRRWCLNFTRFNLLRCQCCLLGILRSEWDSDLDTAAVKVGTVAKYWFLHFPENIFII